MNLTTHKTLVRLASDDIFDYMSPVNEDVELRDSYNRDLYEILDNYFVAGFPQGIDPTWHEETGPEEFGGLPPVVEIENRIQAPPEYMELAANFWKDSLERLGYQVTEIRKEDNGNVHVVADYK